MPVFGEIYTIISEEYIKVTKVTNYMAPISKFYFYEKYLSSDIGNKNQTLKITFKVLELAVFI